MVSPDYKNNAMASKIKVLLRVMYSGHLGDRYTGLGAQTLAPKKYF